MGNSLQDQLLKAGLVNKKQVHKNKKTKHKKVKQQRNQKDAALDENKLLAEKARAEKIQRDRELNQQRQQEVEHKAIIAQIIQLITLNRQTIDGDEATYQFTDNNIIKQIHVSSAMHQQLLNGILSIAKLENDYIIIPTTVAEKICARDKSFIIPSNKTLDSESDDFYADYKVPDDLMW